MRSHNDMKNITRQPHPQSSALALTRGEQVVMQIRERVLAGAYPGGYHMNEAEVSASLGVSRTPVRAALTRLAAEGLLAYTPNTGYVVRSFSRSDIVNIYEVRAVLFGLAAQRAAASGFDERQASEASQILAESIELLGRARWNQACCERWAGMGSSFVSLIEEASDNQYLVEAAVRAREIPGLTPIRFKWLNKEVAQRLHQSHVDLFTAIEMRQTGRAESLGREHIFKLAESVIKEIGGAGA